MSEHIANSVMVRWMSGLVTGLQNRLQRFESASDLILSKNTFVNQAFTKVFFFLHKHLHKLLLRMKNNKHLIIEALIFYFLNLRLRTFSDFSFILWYSGLSNNALSTSSFLNNINLLLIFPPGN